MESPIVCGEYDVEHYFPLMDATVANNHILLHTPFKTGSLCLLYHHLIPCPSFIGNPVHMVHIPSNINVIPQDMSSTDYPSVDILIQCKTGINAPYIFQA